MTKKKRVADWLEKMNVALLVGAVLTKGIFWLPFLSGLCCAYASLKLTPKEEKE